MHTVNIDATRSTLCETKFRFEMESQRGYYFRTLEKTKKLVSLCTRGMKSARNALTHRASNAGDVMITANGFDLESDENVNELSYADKMYVVSRPISCHRRPQNNPQWRPPSRLLPWSRARIAASVSSLSSSYSIKMYS